MSNATHGEILQIIRHGRGMSRSEIARRTGLALSTTSLRVDALIRRRLVTELGPRESPRGGRRAIQLAVDADAGRFGVAMISPTHTEVRLVDYLGGVASSARVDGGALDLSRPDDVVTVIWQEFQRLVASDPLARENGLSCLCVAIGGPIHQEDGAVMSPAALPGWHGFSVRDAFAQLTDVAVLVENMSNLEAIAEWEATGRGVRQLMSVGISSHIGCGLILDGQLFRGAGGGAGEIGHNSVLADAVVPCTCAAPNCLEAAAGGRAIVHLLREAGLEAQGLDDVLRLGNSNSYEAVAVVREAGRVIGASLAATVNLLNPDQLVIAGPLSSCVPLVQAIQSTVVQQALPSSTVDLQVRVSTLGDQAALLGAASLGLEFLLDADRVDLSMS